MEIWYDPDPMATTLESDQFLIDLYEVELKERDPDTLAPWVLRLELDKVRGRFERERVFVLQWLDFFGDRETSSD